MDNAVGIWHLTNGEALSWFYFARRIACALGLETAPIIAETPAPLGWRAPRPHNAALVSTRGALLPTLESALWRLAGASRTI